MNDRYLYRAKRIDSGEWVEGLLTIMWEQPHIIIPEDENTAYPIDESTICQCYGYERIYEHDIFECDGETYEIVFDQDELAWFACGYGYRIQLVEFKPDEINVIGNSFDNPELLEWEE